MTLKMTSLQEDLPIRSHSELLLQLDCLYKELS
jgi:hypothetical protein